jgi:serpin B
MTRLYVLFIFLLIAGLALSGCSANNISINEVSAATRVDPSLVDANTDFAIRLYHEILKEDKNNIFYSPASVAFALSMTYNGAAGETRDAIAQALGIQGLTLDDLNRANADLRSILLNPEATVKTNIANSLWVHVNAQLLDDFVERNNKFFGAEVSTIDLQDKGAPGTINKWVEKETQGKIKDLIDSLDPDAQLVLINAIYFKGDWSKPFEENGTVDDKFHLADRTTKTVPMMYKQDTLQAYAGDGFKAVRLPYGQERYAMYLFLPDGNLKEFYEKLTVKDWQQWMENFEEKQAEIYLPRFKAEYKSELKDALTNLGMGQAFSDFADFSGMTPGGGWCINRVIHQAAIEVNERGTEAAAATAVEMKLTSLPQYFTVRVDRPFFFAIRDDVTGTLLFMGEINNPE